MNRILYIYKINMIVIIVTFSELAQVSLLAG